MTGKTGTLFIVATPIGNLADLSRRATDVLSSVAVIAVEDSRHSGRLLDHLGISKPLIAFHEHNERERFPALLERLRAGDDIALISDAGTPLISDPGYVLVQQARQAGFTVSPIPGACAVIAALSASGLPTDRFQFNGFLPAKSGGRKKVLESLARDQATLVFYEAPHRILASMADVVDVFGTERLVVVARELTKSFETFYSGSAADVLAQLEADPYAAKGELVMMIQGAVAEANEPSIEVDKLLRLLGDALPVKKAAQITAEVSGLPKNELYRRLLEMKDDNA